MFRTCDIEFITSMYYVHVLPCMCWYTYFGFLRDLIGFCNPQIHWVDIWLCHSELWLHIPLEICYIWIQPCIMNWVPCLYLKSRVTVMCIHKSLLMSPKLALNFLNRQNLVGVHVWLVKWVNYATQLICYLKEDFLINPPCSHFPLYTKRKETPCVEQHSSFYLHINTVYTSPGQIIKMLGITVSINFSGGSPCQTEYS